MTATANTKQSAPRPCGCGPGNGEPKYGGCEAGALAPGEIVVERNRYFTGKFMTARDFADEQNYHRSRHELHNRLLHGWGIVCGLNVIEHPYPACRGRYVVVLPGMAIDCYGRELVLKHRQEVDLWEGDPNTKSTFDQGGRLLLSISLDERCGEPTTVMYADGSCDPTQPEYHRIHEHVELTVRPYTKAEIDANCWPERDDGPIDEKEMRARCKACKDGDTGQACLVPACECFKLIPLALITPRDTWKDQPAKPGVTAEATDIDPDIDTAASLARGQTGQAEGKARYTVGTADINLEGRHNVRGAALTHIAGYNWHHGQTMPLSKLGGQDDDGLQGQLRVYFDRQIKESTNALGINQHTFTVEYRSTRGDRYETIMLYNDGSEPYLEDDCVAVFTIPQTYLDGDDVFDDGSIITVTLKCDFIIDCNGRAVDGNHLNGRYGTGNGTEGGVFTSWFIINDDQEAEREQRRYTSARARRGGRQ